MTRGVVIPALPFLPLDEREFTGLTDYQEAVRGYIEPVSIATPPLTLYVNEEGKVRDLETNHRATFIWWVLTPAARGRDLVLGNAVIVAEESDAGSTELLRLIQTAGTFGIDVQTAEEPETWRRCSGRFGSWFDAAFRAIQLHHEWPAVTDVRVVPV